jgi:hypothetical protein
VEWLNDFVLQGGGAVLLHAVRLGIRLHQKRGWRLARPERYRRVWFTSLLPRHEVPYARYTGAPRARLLMLRAIEARTYEFWNLEAAACTLMR